MLPGMSSYDPTEARATLKAYLDRKDEKLATWCRRAGVAEGAVRGFLNGRSNSLSGRTLQRLADADQVDIADLLPRRTQGGSTMPIPKPSPILEYQGDLFVTVGVYDQSASAGPGSLVPTTTGTLEPMHLHMFRKQWLDRVSNAKPDQLAMMRVRGDSMWDTLHDGDHVLIDMMDKNYRKNSMFVINVEGELMVKRLSYDPEERRVTISSDNASYKEFSVRPGTIEIIGRVIWLGRHLG